MTDLNANALFNKISAILENAQRRVLNLVNQTIVLTYYEIGRIIVEEEQNGNERADYGKHLLTEISKRLTKNFGKGFSETNLKQMRHFYLVYSKGQTVSDEFRLSWSHYLKLMRIDNTFV